jgi:hypothetical protein
MPKKKKRNASDIREEMQHQGAHFFRFVSSPQLTNNWLNEWTAIQKYGFFVCSTGCLLPYQYYRRTSRAGDKLKGHQRAVHFFLGRECDRTARTNQFGWPCDEQVSHLCHNPDCINPLHIVIEPRWKNVKRNYCGINGSCDCGVLPACVRTYTNPETFAQDLELVKDRAKVLELLASLQQTHRFSLLSPDFYRVENQKIDNRKKRKEAGLVTKQQKEKKQKRKERKEERADSSVAKHSLKEEEDSFQEFEPSPEEIVDQ